MFLSGLFNVLTYSLEKILKAESSRYRFVLRKQAVSIDVWRNFYQKFTITLMCIQGKSHKYNWKTAHLFENYALYFKTFLVKEKT